MLGAFVIVLVALTWFGLQTPNEEYAPVPNADQVRWVSLGLYPVQLPGTVPQPLVATRPDDAEVIERLLSWLEDAPITLGSLDGLSELHNVPSVMFGLADGRRLRLVPAMECVHVAAGTRCGRIDNYVSFSDGSTKGWTLRSAPLAAWLANGWRADLRLGDYEGRNVITENR
jgi:hypothetical protein